MTKSKAEERSTPLGIDREKSTASSQSTTWEARVVFTARSAFQVIAASEEEATQIAIADIKGRPFTDAVQIILSKVWKA